MNRFELKLQDGKVATWDGKDGLDAARRYVDTCGGTVVAWREADRYGIHVGIPYGA
jgi:hypothetical protein